jgi:RND family efflux transporter MFP subunit
MKFLTVIFAIAASACTSSSAPESQGMNAVSVATAAAVSKRVPKTFEAGGVVRARIAATLASRITAPVLAVHVAAGDRVRTGQPLIVFDGRDLDAQRARAAAEVTAMERAHAATVADRGAADAALTLARAYHRRIAALHAHDAATAQDLDEAVSALQVAEARLGAADAHAAAAEASLDGARQSEAAARATASYATLTAPFDGVITERLVDPGALAAPGAPLLRIDDTRRFRLEVVVDESRLPTMAEGAHVEVLFDDDEGEGSSPASLKGTVAEVSRALDAGSHSFLVKVDLPSQATVRSGMFGRARFATGDQALLTIPAEAIVPQGQLSTVFVVSTDQRAQMRVIDVGVRTSEWVEVLAGVSAGEQVVLSPMRVHDGTPVRTAGSEGRR